MCCTLRSGLHKIPTMIRTFPHGSENNHACKWISDKFPWMLTYVLFLENCLKSICMHGCSPIHVERSFFLLKSMGQIGDQELQLMETTSVSRRVFPISIKCVWPDIREKKRKKINFSKAWLDFTVFWDMLYFPGQQTNSFCWDTISQQPFWDLDWW